MAEPIVEMAAIAVATIWENKARGSGRIFWKLITASGENYTAFSRVPVARFLDGAQGVQRNESVVYNFKPPINAVVYYEAGTKGRVLVPTPEGVVEVEPTPPPQVSDNIAPTTTPSTINTPAPRSAYGGAKFGGYQKPGGGWKPEDKRPGLVTMNEAYAKDIVAAVIGNSDDLKAQDPDAVLNWATTAILGLSKLLLKNTLDELKELGFNPAEAPK